MAALSNIRRNIFLKSFMQRNGLPCCRLVSTTGKKEDSTTSCDKAQVPPEAVYRKVPDFSKPLDNKNWISYGFDYEDEEKDRLHMHMSFFLIFSFLLCGLVFLYKYCPDRGMKDWARREAFIRLHERESLGLEPIDPNYIDPSKIILPPDEELSEEDIVI